MIQIGDVVVSFDVLREKFICNLDACKGACCIEGDAGAPVELEEIEKLEEVLDDDRSGAKYLFDPGSCICRSDQCGYSGEKYFDRSDRNDLSAEFKVDTLRSV